MIPVRWVELPAMVMLCPAPLVGSVWRIPGMAHRDMAAIEVLDGILTTGESSRLYKSLVRDKRIATEAGAQLVVLTPETLRALRTALEQVLDEEAAKSEQFKKVLENWRAFRAEQHRWLSVADARTEMSVYARTAAGSQ